MSTASILLHRIVILLPKVVMHGIGTDSGGLEKQILSLHGAANHMADEQV